LAIHEKLGDRRSAAWMVNSLGLLARDQKEWEKALGYYQQALEVFKELGLRSAQAIVWRNIGDAHRGAKKRSEAEVAYQRALRLFEKIGDRREIGRTLLGEAKLYFKTWHPIAAVCSAVRALRIMHQLQLLAISRIRRELMAWLDIRIRRLRRKVAQIGEQEVRDWKAKQ
jgi:tetratricopeptide (TPR) repeat protein